MDLNSSPNGYATTTMDPPKIGPHWDPLGEYEYHNTVYTVSVCAPARPPPRFLPSFLTRKPVVVNPSTAHVIRPPREHPPPYDCFDTQDLDCMKISKVKIKAHDFPPEMRCRHVSQGRERTCDQGCYVLEKGGPIRRWRCKRSDCKGHVYVGPVKKDSDGVACFGKRRRRMVCVELL